MKPQHLEALDRANEIRLARADVKRRIGRGEITVVDALGLEACRSMPIGELLRAQHRWGVTRTRRFLARVGMSELKRVGSLTERQRGLVADALMPGQVAA